MLPNCKRGGENTSDRPYALTFCRTRPVLLSARGTEPCTRVINRLVTVGASLDHFTAAEPAIYLAGAELFGDAAKGTKTVGIVDIQHASIFFILKTDSLQVRPAAERNLCATQTGRATLRANLILPGKSL